MNSKHSPENKAKVSDDNSNFVAIPKRYRKLDVKYNKLGSDDFQFDQYNKTVFSGLESTLPNAYCNGMLQVIRSSLPSVPKLFLNNRLYNDQIFAGTLLLRTSKSSSDVPSM